MNSIQELTDIVSGAQLADVLSVYANAINANKSALNTKANAASLGAATTRITALEDEKASKAELQEALTGADILDKTTRQLAVMYFLPPYQEGKVYQKDMIIRMDGRVFKSLTDGNTACPYTVLTDEDGTIIVNDNWEALILDNVMTDNWAQLDETLIPTTSIPDRMTNIETRQTDLEDDYETWQTNQETWKQTMQSQNATQLQTKLTELEAQYATQFNDCATALSQAQSLIQQQQAIIQNLTARLAYLDNLTIMVSDNRNDSDSYTDSNQ